MYSPTGIEQCSPGTKSQWAIQILAVCTNVCIFKTPIWLLTCLEQSLIGTSHHFLLQINKKFYIICIFCLSFFLNRNRFLILIDKHSLPFYKQWQQCKQCREWQSIGLAIYIISNISLYCGIYISAFSPLFPLVRIGMTAIPKLFILS